MAKDLDVDTGGLRAAAFGGEQIAAGLLAGSSGSAAVSARPSGAGIAALDAAGTAVRTRQANRITGQAGDVAIAGGRYDETDGGSAETIASVPV